MSLGLAESAKREELDSAKSIAEGEGIVIKSGIMGSCGRHPPQFVEAPILV